MRWIALCCMVTAAAAEEGGHPVAPSPIREVAELRLELYRQGIEFQDWKIEHLEGDLDRALVEQRKALEEERAAIEELTGGNSETGEVAGRRAETDRELPQLRELQRSRQVRVAELNDRLVKERHRKQLLVHLAEQAAARLRNLESEQRKEIKP